MNPTQVTIDQAMEIAVQHRLAGRLEQAEQLCRQIISAQPNHAGGLNLLAVIAYQAGRNDIAIDLVRRAIAVNATAAEYHSNLGNFLQADGHIDDAITSYLKAIEINPDLAEVHNNLGSAFTRLGQLERAIVEHRAAIRLNPQLVQAHCNLGNALSDLGHIDQAIAAYRTALAIEPDNADVHWNLAMCLLLKGDFASGWSEYEWRWKCGNVEHNFSQPKWTGEALTGRTILLHAEQGFGDTLQFIRYLPLVQARGGNVIVECQPQLIRLLRQLSSTTKWIARGQPLPPFDLHCPLMSLPFVFGTTLQNIPPAPLLRALSDYQSAKGFKVGLVWAGSPHHKNDRNRSIPYSFFAPLLAIPKIEFITLQKGALGSAILDDFSDTAALIATLDLVISVDTAVAHLASAMGKPIWLLLPFAPDWRWLQERADSPWYPTMRIFRQPKIGDWASVLQRVAVELEIFTH